MTTNKFQILASSSSGNAAIIEHGDTTILLDAGLSMRKIRLALQARGKSVDDLDAVLLTHEHSDHIKGVKMLVKYFPDLPIFASKGTLTKVDDGANVTVIKRGVSFDIGSLSCHPYRIQHDAKEPLSFRFDGDDGVALGWATDLGFWDDETVEHLSGCQTLVVESNHDPEMLKAGPYPAFLKRRVGGSYGHLSNVQARWLVDRVTHPGLEHVVLGHLSDKNNDPKLAFEMMQEVLRGADTELVVANLKTESEARLLRPVQHERRAGEPVKEAAPVKAPPEQQRLF